MYTVFFFNDTATTEIYTLSLHDALPISSRVGRGARRVRRSGNRNSDLRLGCPQLRGRWHGGCPDAAHSSRRGGNCLQDRKNPRLNSSPGYISYAVFCLKKKINNFVRQAN